MQTPVIAIFDIGKTNKKLLLLDEQYGAAYEQTEQIPEITDEDGLATEDIGALTAWIRNSFEMLLKEKRFLIKAIHFACYGASLVYLDEKMEVMLPLYNYLKPYPKGLEDEFYNSYGGKEKLSLQTASPALGSLNAGLQIYRLKKEKPGDFRKIKWILHLPQYLAYLFSSSVHTEITSIGCHTLLWDFKKQQYHDWVRKEGIDRKLPPLVSAQNLTGYYQDRVAIGAGLHDSSAALIPYLVSFDQPFILLSTGTWSISMNPFNHSQLTIEELALDCLCYLSYQEKPVKASRLFAGYEHEQELKRLGAHFLKAPDYYKTVSYDGEMVKSLLDAGHHPRNKSDGLPLSFSSFSARSIDHFSSFEQAYHQLMIDIIIAQVSTTHLVMTKDVRKIFVDGGFSNNEIYLALLAIAYPTIEVYAAFAPRASAIGAALAIHSHWNNQPVVENIIGLKRYFSPIMNSRIS